MAVDDASPSSSSSEYETDDEWEAERMKLQATMLKDEVILRPLSVTVTHGWMSLSCHGHAWLDVSVLSRSRMAGCVCLVTVTHGWMSLSCHCHAWLDVSVLSLLRLAGCVSCHCHAWLDESVLSRSRMAECVSCHSHAWLNVSYLVTVTHG